MAKTWLSWLNYWENRAGWATCMRAMAQHELPLAGASQSPRWGLELLPPPQPPAARSSRFSLLWPPQRQSPLWPFPSLRHTNLWWYLLLGGAVGTPEPKAALTPCRHSANTLRLGAMVALDVHAPITGLWWLPTNEGAAQGVQWPPWHQGWAGSRDSSATDPRPASWLQRKKGVMCLAGIPKLWVVSFNLGKHLIQCVTTHHIYLILSSFGYDYCHVEWKLSDAPWAKKILEDGLNQLVPN